MCWCHRGLTFGNAGLHFVSLTMSVNILLNRCNLLWTASHKVPQRLTTMVPHLASLCLFASPPLLPQLLEHKLSRRTGEPLGQKQVAEVKPPYHVPRKKNFGMCILISNAVCRIVRDVHCSGPILRLQSNVCVCKPQWLGVAFFFLGLGHENCVERFVVLRAAVVSLITVS